MSDTLVSMSTDTEQPDHTIDNFQELVDAFGPQIYALASRFCGTPEDAEDLVQEVFLQAYRAWPSFEHRSSVKTWLYTIAARTCQRMHRKRAGEPKRIGSLDDLLPFGEPRISIIPADQPEALQLQIQREAREQVEAAIVSLPEEFRIPLILKDIVGLSMPEIAEILGEKPGTIRSRIHRARLRLRDAAVRAVPKADSPAPLPAYSQQTCLDLLHAKQEALDRGVPFDSGVICERCRSVFATLDLTQDVCRQLALDELPDRLVQRLSEASLASAASKEGKSSSDFDQP